QLLKDGFVVNTILKEADLFCPNSVRINFTIYLTIIVQHKETALLQMNTGIKPFRNILNFILFHPAT
ncbi:hypothetical protein EFR49_09965, partial [Latilactobacillus curvatus]|nr:hypothetical protein [Latilactobacillus curvatus]